MMELRRECGASRWISARGQLGSSGFTGFVTDQETQVVDEPSGSAGGAAAPESGPQTWGREAFTDLQ